jgi:hypothetical protein
VLGIEILCKKCKAPLRLIALIKSEDTAKPAVRSASRNQPH